MASCVSRPFSISRSSTTSSFPRSSSNHFGLICRSWSRKPISLAFSEGLSSWQAFSRTSMRAAASPTRTSNTRAVKGSTTLSFGSARFHGPRAWAPTRGVVEAVCDGAAAGVRDVGLPTKLIGILSRTFGVRAVDAEREALLTLRDKLVALDLAGDEASVPGTEFVDHFRRGRDAGWRITVHAGEVSGAQSVWQALNELGATRIGHGVRATEDTALLDYLAEHAIGIESCLTSNIQTSTVSSLETPPAQGFSRSRHPGDDQHRRPDGERNRPGARADHRRPRRWPDTRPRTTAQENALEIAFLEPDERKALLKAEG